MMAIIDDYAGIAAEMRRIQAEKSRKGSLPMRAASQRHCTLCGPRSPASSCTGGCAARAWIGEVGLVPYKPLARYEQVRHRPLGSRTSVPFNLRSRHACASR